MGSVVHHKSYIRYHVVSCKTVLISSNSMDKTVLIPFRYSLVPFSPYWWDNIPNSLHISSVKLSWRRGSVIRLFVLYECLIGYWMYNTVNWFLKFIEIDTITMFCCNSCIYKLPINEFRAICDILAIGGDTDIVCWMRWGDCHGITSVAFSSHWLSRYNGGGSSVLMFLGYSVIGGISVGFPFWCSSW